MSVAVNFEVLEGQLSGVEMALLMAINVTMNAALLAGAPSAQMMAHFKQHEANFAALKKRKAEHVMAALHLLTANATRTRS